MKRLRENPLGEALEAGVSGVPEGWACAGDSPIRVALVSAGADAVAEAVETLLADAPEFACERCPFSPDVAIRPQRLGAVGRSAPHIVIVALDASQIASLSVLFAALRASFASMPLLAIPVQPETFDVGRALEFGATDFLLPPLRRAELFPRLLHHARVPRGGTAEMQKLKAEIGLQQIVGESPALLAEIRRVPRFARSDATVLISGESGTGKEVFTRAIHYLSPRAGGPFVPVSCGALPEHLVESELFGHTRSAPRHSLRP